MKLIVQIACLNEEATLPQTVADIPRNIDGVDAVELLVIDDGSTDGTLEVARSLGVDHLVVNKTNRGLAQAFRIGLDACLQLGADIIVNTDGDNQYCGKDIPRLIQPILDGTADIVIGDRDTAQIEHFSKTKKLLQKIGGKLVRRLSGTDVRDVVSGFRAYSRDAALQTNVVSNFSYTVETLVQAGRNRLALRSVRIRTNPKTRESRLYKSTPRYIERQATTVMRMYSMYQPLRSFFYIGLVLTAIGIIPVLRFLVFFFIGDGAGHVQSLILGGVFMVLGFVTFLIALLADLIGFNRRLLEITLEKVRRIELEQITSKGPGDDFSQG